LGFAPKGAEPAQPTALTVHSIQASLTGGARRLNAKTVFSFRWYVLGKTKRQLFFQFT
jgi:hypothetical protein